MEQSSIKALFFKKKMCLLIDPCTTRAGGLAEEAGAI